MRTLGLIGGTSWASSAVYYRLLNEAVEARLGPPHSARLVMVSVDFADIAPAVKADDWPALEALAIAAAHQLKTAGAQALMIASNTIQRAADEAGNAAGLHVLHLTDITARHLEQIGVRRAGLLGTEMTMSGPFYRSRLAASFGCETLIPDEAARRIVDRIIFEELTRGVVTSASRTAYRDVMAALVERGAEAIILGCTELSLLVSEADAEVPVIDTTALHVEAALNWALA